MSDADADAGRTILLLGSPRSGTTWVAKIFDSHPDVLYRHEPDTVLRNERLQGFLRPADIPGLKAEARDYLERLFATRTLKTVGSMPIFPKSYYSNTTQTARRAMIYSLRAAEQLSSLRRRVKTVGVPDFLPRSRRVRLHRAMKSVSSLGRVGLLAHAIPNCRIIYIVRDPCGQVASVLRGDALGKFEHGVHPEELLQTEQAARYGLTAERLAAMPRVQQLAWLWAVLNEKAIADLQDVPGARVLRYQDLCTDPLEQSKELFAFAGLSWNDQTERFVRESTRSNAPDRYFQVFKNTEAAMNRWRRELSADDQQLIIDVVKQTPMAAFCHEYFVN